jgi:hypothetical protein
VIDEIIEKLTLENMSFYMSENQMDQLDVGGYSRKANELYKLRGKLVGLSMPEFDLTMKTLNSLLEGKKLENREEKKVAHQQSQINAAELFQSLDPNEHQYA